MRKIILYTFLILIFEPVYLLGIAYVTTTIDNISTQKLASQVEEKSIFETLNKPIFWEPSKISFNNKNLEITEVGVDKSGVMETPIEWGRAGWYSESAKPGEPGNLVINGHYDDSLGRPAAFWELKNLKIDDTVVVFNKLGRTYSYKVVDSFFVNINDPNRLEILKSNNEVAELTLITCGGIWDSTRHTYDRRLVVKARLI
jgi:LPXTG-site transpeptidase (sortase) family protein